jgi:hypothetical protein
MQPLCVDAHTLCSAYWLRAVVTSPLCVGLCAVSFDDGLFSSENWGYRFLLRAAWVLGWSALLCLTCALLVTCASFTALPAASYPGVKTGRTAAVLTALAGTSTSPGAPVTLQRHVLCVLAGLLLLGSCAVGANATKAYDIANYLPTLPPGVLRVSQGNAVDAMWLAYVLASLVPRSLHVSHVSLCVCMCMCMCVVEQVWPSVFRVCVQLGADVEEWCVRVVADVSVGGPGY